MIKVLAALGVLAAGGLLTVQPAVNAQLARHTNVLGAALISSCVTTVVLTAVLLVAGGGFGVLRDAAGISPLLLTGGVIGAVPLIAWLSAVGTLGTGGVFAVTVCGQMLVSPVLLDRLGLIGLDRIALTAPRVLGIVLVIAGTMLVTTTR